MGDFDCHVTISDPLLACCLCHGLLDKAVQLICLHCCCRQCFREAALENSIRCVRCSICGTVTQERCERPNGFIDGQVARYGSVAYPRAPGKCIGNLEHDKLALVWCPACRHTVCGDCITAHRQCFRQHSVLSPEELRRLDEICETSGTARCAIHHKPLDIACVNCEKIMCISCWAECKKKKHEMHTVGDEAFGNYVGKFIASISAMESELLLKSKVLKRPASNLQDAKSSRDRHLHELNDRKQRIVDAVEMVYQQIKVSTKNAYDDIEAEGNVEVAVAARIDSALSDARSYIRRLIESNDNCEIIKQQKIVQQRLNTLSAELDSMSYRLATTVREVKFEATLPDDLENLVRSWIGMPVMSSASSYASHIPPLTQARQQQQSFWFGAASISVQLPFMCQDVALTKDGLRLLLAAGCDGLLELSVSDGHELSRWHPPTYESGGNLEYDLVKAVSALSDGRAAVSLYRMRLVVLLRREEKVSSSSSNIATATAAGDAWIEQFRFDPLPWPASRLSGHGDVLVASQVYSRGTAAEIVTGNELQLLSLSSGRRLGNAVLREYHIDSLAVTADLVVTGSYYPVELGDGCGATHVIDAHRLAERGSDERLWRYVLSRSDELEYREFEVLRGICADSLGGCLYAVLCRNDHSSSRVCVLSLTDGSELRSIALSFNHPAKSAGPFRLSLSDCGAAAEQQPQSCDSGAAAEQQPQSSDSSSRVVLLAVLHNLKAVTVHHGCRDMAALLMQHM